MGKHLSKLYWQWLIVWVCLYYPGILDFDDEEEDDEGDEILRELKAKQAELKEICQHNVIATKKLFKLAKDEQARQELRRKLATSDTEVGSLVRVYIHITSLTET